MSETSWVMGNMNGPEDSGCLEGAEVTNSERDPEVAVELEPTDPGRSWTKFVRFISRLWVHD